MIEIATVADALPLPVPILSDHFYPFGRRVGGGATIFLTELKSLSGFGK